MDTTTIETRIHAAIRPQLDECDRLLDYYLQDAPREVWEPIAYKFKPKTDQEKQVEILQAQIEVIQVWVPQVVEQFQRFGNAVSEAFSAFKRTMNEPLDRDDFTTAQ